MAGQEPWQMVPATASAPAGALEIPIRLGSDETLVWAGRPGRARPSLFVILLGLGITSLAVGWIVVGIFGLDRLREQVGSLAWALGFLPCCGIPFLFVGLAILFSPVRQWRTARRTCYLLTTRRAIVCEPGWGRSMNVYSYTPDALGRIQCHAAPDGTGDLVFEEHGGFQASINQHQTAHPLRRGFLGIDRVREVEQLVRQTLGL